MFGSSSPLDGNSKLSTNAPSLTKSDGQSLSQKTWSGSPLTFVIVVGVDNEPSDGLSDGLADALANGLADVLVEGLVEGLAVGLADRLVDGLADGLADGLVEGIVVVVSLGIGAPVTVYTSGAFGASNVRESSNVPSQ